MDDGGARADRRGNAKSPDKFLIRFSSTAIPLAKPGADPWFFRAQKAKGRRGGEIQWHLGSAMSGHHPGLDEDRLQFIADRFGHFRFPGWTGPLQARPALNAG